MGELNLVGRRRGDNQVGPHSPQPAEQDRSAGLYGHPDDALASPESVDHLEQGRREDRDPLCGPSHDQGAVGRTCDRHGIERGGRAGGLGALSACGGGKQERKRRARERYATHCHRVHWVTKTPSSIALTPTIAVCTRGLPPITASARKKGKMARPRRGSDWRGPCELGVESGRARLRV